MVEAPLILVLFKMKTVMSALKLLVKAPKMKNFLDLTNDSNYK